MVDFHAHILPGMDHGCADGETATQQLYMARCAGVDTVVVTPHFYPQWHDIDTYLTAREEAVSRLLALNGQGLRLFMGAEVQLCPGVDHMERLRELRIGQTEVILLELPPFTWTQELLYTLERLLDNPEFTPVLAHVDRYPPEAIEPLLEMGILGQVNAAALCRLTGKRRLLRWIDSGWITALGSDLHGTDIGYGDFLQAIRFLGTERTQRLMHCTDKLLHIE